MNKFTTKMNFNEHDESFFSIRNLSRFVRDMALCLEELTSWTRYERFLYWFFYLTMPGVVKTVAAWRGFLLVGAISASLAASALTPHMVAGGVGLILLVVVGAVLFVLLFPCILRAAMGLLPNPRGAHPVGTRTIEVPIDGQMLRVQLYYPCVKPLKRCAQQAPWIPELDYAVGYGVSMGLEPKWAAYFLSGLCSARMAAQEEGTPIAQALPLAVFSHGLCGTATTYSTLCIELASLGYLVAAPEHADGTAATTITSTRKIVYGDLGKDRGKQIHSRLAEIRAVQTHLRSLNSDGAFEARLPPASFHQSVVLGHSFGAATAVATCSAVGCETFGFQRVIALDPWLSPLSQQQNAIGSLPALVVNTGSMMYEQSVRDICHMMSTDSADSTSSTVGTTSAPLFLEICRTRHQVS
jgi:platelet-activating factor acetylhydrolase